MIALQSTYAANKATLLREREEAGREALERLDEAAWQQHGIDGEIYTRDERGNWVLVYHLKLMPLKLNSPLYLGIDNIVYRKRKGTKNHFFRAPIHWRNLGGIARVRDAIDRLR